MDLAYAILESFETLAYHLYQIKFKKKIYDCGIIREIDTTGKLTRYTIRADGRLGNLYDYRNFSLGNNRARVRRMFGKIKEGYEGE